MLSQRKKGTLINWTKKNGLAFLFLLVAVHVSAFANADTLVNLQRKNISVSEVFKVLKQQTGLIVFYNNNVLDDKRRVDVDFNKVSVTEVMNFILKGTNISYVLKDNFILLQKKMVSSQVSSLLAQPEVQGSYSASQPADTTLRGSVSSDSSLPLSGVSVQLKGSSIGTTTDSAGRFSLRVPNANGTLIFSFVGYQNEELKITDRKNLNVQLHATPSDLQQVVVIGYGAVKKSDVTGSLVSLKASDLTPGANVNVQQMLQGRASGVNIQQKSGEPGSAISVQVRGITSITAGNDPLYVIDGMPVNNDAPVSGSGAFFSTPSPRNPLNSLNPSDIASIDILKDASATAIYGSRGANGVVIITTKSGSANRFAVNYNAYYGFQEVAKKEKDLNPQQYHDIINDIIADGGGLATDTVASNFGTGTDWQSQLYQHAAVQSHDLSVSGGAKNTKYFLSVGYYDQAGILKNSGTKRYTARVNLDNTVAKKYSVGINLNTSYIRDNYNSSGIGTNEDGGAVYAAINYDPTSPIYAADGSYYRSPYMNVDNPAALINGETGIGNSYRTFGTVYGEYFIIPSLSVKVRAGGDINNNRSNFWVSPITQSGKPYNGVASILTGTKSYYMGEGTINYNQSGKNHSLNAVAGITYEHFGTNTFSGNGRGYSLPDLTYNAIGSGDATQNIIGSGYDENIISSYLARANYSYKDKYLLTASIRTDGSARFGQNNKFGYFPSGAIGWKLDKERFIQNIKPINDLKLRVSYGQTGNQSIGNYLYISSFAGSANVVFNSTVYNSISPVRKPNPDLQWEVAKQFDAGLDFSILNRKLRGSIEYYIRKTSNLLVDLPLPANTGYASQIQNIGSMRNNGWDFQLNADIIKSSSFTWNINGNLSFYKNKVVSIGPLTNIISGATGINGGLSIITPGVPLQSYYGYVIDGTWQEKDDFSVTKDKVKPGDVKYRDINGDSTITDKDRTVLGQPFPKYTYGITNTFSYKNLNLTVFIEGSHGASLLYNSMVDAYFPISLRRNKLAEPYLNRWTPENPTNDYPSFVNPVAEGQRQVNSKTVMDASYLRLQSMRLGYDFNFRNKKVIKALSVYATAQNLFIITNYKGIDPTANASTNSVQRIDFSSYPYTKTYTFGINAEF